MKPALIKGTRKYLEGNLEKHKMNAEMLFEKGAAVAEHPGYLETIEQEMQKKLILLAIVMQSTIILEQTRQFQNIS